jgi:uncharacterized Rossmann fold enzyme
MPSVAAQHSSDVEGGVGDTDNVTWLSDSSLEVVEHDVLGYTLQFEQRPMSKHLGFTVWDAAVVLAKVFEHVRPLVLVGGDAAAAMP